MEAREERRNHQCDGRCKLKLAAEELVMRVFVTSRSRGYGRWLRATYALADVIKYGLKTYAWRVGG